MTQEERTYLRELAKRQLEIANLPVMRERERNWLRLNTGKSAAPPVVVETWTFDVDMMPEGIQVCRSDDARRIEYELLKNVREHEFIDDDKVIPDFFPVDHVVEMDEFGIKVEERHAVDGNGREVGYASSHPIQDLEVDLGRLEPVRLRYDAQKTRETAEFIQDAIGDILPIQFRGYPRIVSMTECAIRLMGMEALALAVYEQPDAVHALMRYLTDSQLEVMRFYEREGILTLNNGNHETGKSSFGFTDRLPRVEGRDHVALEDIWMWVEAEETLIFSPEMFREFFLPYFAEASAPLGLVYYGCCEPLQRIWPSLAKAIPNLAKASVSTVCDQKAMGDFLRGTEIVFSRKPSPNYLGVDACLDEEAWRSHIRETLEAARGCQCEILIRDVYKVKDLAGVRRAVDIAREEVVSI